jgi:hypothetical protein
MRTEELNVLKEEYPDLAQQASEDPRPKVSSFVNMHVKFGSYVFSQDIGDDYAGLSIDRTKIGVYLLEPGREPGTVSFLPTKKGIERLNDMTLIDFMENGYQEGLILKVAYIPAIDEKTGADYYQRVIK